LPTPETLGEEDENEKNEDGDGDKEKDEDATVTGKSRSARASSERRTWRRAGWKQSNRGAAAAIT
jgi:hypothetical protein